MAVRDDFAPGEVLAAADLNDTFAAKLDVSAYDPGLIHLHTETFSAVSSVSVTSKFSSTYDYYMVLYNATCTSEEDLRLRLRSGSTDNSATNYDTQLNFSFGNTAGFQSYINETSWRVGRIIDTGGSGTIHLFNPSLAATTLMTVKAGHKARFSDLQGIHDVSTAFDGFTVFVGSGTMTGALRVYGYANA